MATSKHLLARVRKCWLCQGGLHMVSTRRGKNRILLFSSTNHFRAIHPTPLEVPGPGIGLTLSQGTNHNKENNG